MLDNLSGGEALLLLTNLVEYHFDVSCKFSLGAYSDQLLLRVAQLPHLLRVNRIGTAP